MSSLFTCIINGEVPCHKILEDEQYLAFLDIRPINPGHTLVIPKQEVDYIFDLDEQLLSGLMVFAKKVAGLIEKEIECKRIGVMVAGLEVPHTHIHLIPMNTIADLNFANATATDSEELAKVSERIRKHIY